MTTCRRFCIIVLQVLIRGGLGLVWGDLRKGATLSVFLGGLHLAGISDTIIMAGIPGTLILEVRCMTRRGKEIIIMKRIEHIQELSDAIIDILIGLLF